MESSLGRFNPSRHSLRSVLSNLTTCGADKR